MQMPNDQLAVLPIQNGAGYLPASTTHPSTHHLKANVETPVQSRSPQPTDVQAVLMGALTVLVPLSFWVSIVVHRRLRTNAFQRQIATLERIWSLNCHKEIQ